MDKAKDDVTHHQSLWKCEGIKMFVDEEQDVKALMIKMIDSKGQKISVAVGGSLATEEVEFMAALSAATHTFGAAIGASVSGAQNCESMEQGKDILAAGAAKASGRLQ